MTPLLLLLAALLAGVVFSLYPGLDLAVSGAFYDPAEGFWLSRVRLLEGLRLFAWDLEIAVFLLALLALGASLWLRADRAVPARIWGFVVASFALGPILIVNGLLKPYWGRARPADIVEFGGAHQFTPALRIAGECSANCSFVSGEAAGAVTLAAVAGALVWPHLGGARRLAALAALSGFALVASALRVVTGRHFLSDVIFAALTSLAVAAVLYRGFGIASARRSLTGKALRADLAAIFTRLFRRR